MEDIFHMTKNQWAVLPNDSFTAIGTTVSHLPPAIYTLSSDGGAIFFHKTKVLTDNLIYLDDSAALRIIAGIEKFWESKSKFIVLVFSSSAAFLCG